MDSEKPPFDHREGIVGLAGLLLGSKAGKKENAILARLSVLHILSGPQKPSQGHADLLRAVNASYLRHPMKGSQFSLLLTSLIDMKLLERGISGQEDQYSIARAGRTYLEAVISAASYVETPEKASKQAAPFRTGELRPEYNIPTIWPAFLQSRVGESRLGLELVASPDPICGSIPLDSYASGLVKTFEVQRLRLIKQLSFADVFFPSCNHSRYEHALGTYHMAKLAVERISSSPDSELSLNKDQKDLVTTAALLHDLGHGPFCHAAETYLRRKGLASPLDRHEYYSAQLIRHPSNQLKAALTAKRENSRFSQEDLENVAKIVDEGHKLGSDEYPLQLLVSGPLDLDRLDYVNRDSYYVGRYPGPLEWNKLVDNYIFRRFPGPMNLVIRSSALDAAESFVFRRMTLYNVLYHHPINRLCQEMIVRAIDIAYSDGTFEPHNFMRLVDSDLVHILLSKDGLPHDLMVRVLTGRLYQTVFDTTYRMLDNKESILRLGSERERASELFEIEKRVAQKLNVRYGELIIDVPDKPKFIEPGVWVMAKDGSATMLRENVGWIRGTSENDMLYDPERWRVRVYAVETLDPEKAAKTIREELLAQ